MGHCRTVGDVRETFRHEFGVDLEWEIPEFFSLPDSPDCIFYSPDFYHVGASWYLIVYPNGQAYCGTQGWIVLFLCRRLCSPQRAVRFGLGIRRADGAEEELLGDLRLPEGCTHIRINELLLRSDLLKRKCQLAPSNSLTVTCRMYRDETPCVRGINLTNDDEQKPTRVQFKLSEQMDKNTKTEDILKCRDKQKPTSVQIKFNEQMDQNARTGVASMESTVKRAMKCILKYFGNCVGRHY